MSSTQWSVKITNSASGGDVYFSSHQFVSGSIAETRKSVVEPLQSSGVDGRRFRKNSKQAPPWVLRVTEPVSDWVDLETRLYDLVGDLVTVQIKAGTTVHTFPKCTVVDCGGFRRMRQTIGYGSISGATKTLMATITIERPNLNTDDA